MNEKCSKFLILRDIGKSAKFLWGVGRVWGTPYVKGSFLGW